MGEATPRQLRQLTDLAGRLNDFSKQTNDPAYSALFLKAAEEILQQTRMLTPGGQPMADFQQISKPPNFPEASTAFPNPKAGAAWDAVSGGALTAGPGRKASAKA